MWFSERVNKIAVAFADRFNFQVETVIHQYYVEFICTYTKEDLISPFVISVKFHKVEINETEDEQIIQKMEVTGMRLLWQAVAWR